MDYIVIEWNLLSTVAMWIVVIGLPLLVVLRLIEAYFNVSEGVSLSAYYRRELDKANIEIEEIKARLERIRRE
jgi:hypothetical protein